MALRKFRSIPKTTFLTFLLALAGCVGGVMVFIAWVDPYGLVHQLTSNSKGNLRLCSYESRRTIKALQIAHGQWDGIIIGSSREEWGINPDDGLFKQKHVYNAGLPGVSADEYFALIRFAMKHQKIEYLLIDLDPMAFGRPKPGGAADFEKSPLAGRPLYGGYLNYLFNQTILIETYNWLRKPKEALSRVCHTNGNRFIGDRPKTEKYGDYFVRSTKVLFKSHADRLGSYDLVKARFVELGEVLKEAASKNVVVDIFIAPNHAIVGEYLRRAGWHENFLQFRRDATELVERLNASAQSKISIWDFSGYNSVTTEGVSGVDQDASLPMKKYYDNLHVQPPIMAAMVCRMQNYVGAGCKDVSREKFGDRLSSSMLAEWEQTEEDNRVRYLSTHPKISEFVTKMEAESKIKPDSKTSLSPVSK